MAPRCPIFAILVLLGPVLGPRLDQAQATERAASQIYQWTNQNGEVQFSDRRPANGSAPHKVISVPETATPAPADGNDPYSVENQARRMEADRKQREESRLRAERERWEARQLAIEERKRLAELEAAEARAQWEKEGGSRPIYGGYGYPIRRRPRCCRPGGGHRPGWPVHPIHPVAPSPRLVPRTHINSPIGAGGLWRAPGR